jgi:hypothetical protein
MELAQVRVQWWALLLAVLNLCVLLPAGFAGGVTHCRHLPLRLPVKRPTSLIISVGFAYDLGKVPGQRVKRVCLSGIQTFWKYVLL